MESFPQHDIGDILRLSDASEKPEVTDLSAIHGGARRLVGGMGSLITAIGKQLPADRLHLQHALVSVRENGDSVILHFRRQQELVTITARHVILAIPPRLVEEQIQFTPTLDEPIRASLRTTPTWMANQAKAVVAYDRAFWREAGRSGNAFVTHEQVVLPEIFDACDSTGEQAALGAFFSLDPDFRGNIPPATMRLLVSSQLVQVFDLPAEDGEQQIFDWAQENHTCSTLDYAARTAHPDYGNPTLRLLIWNHKLFLGGSETAGYDGGYLEGALEAAARIQRLLLSTLRGEAVVLAANGAEDNVACLGKFSAWVTAQQSHLLASYRRHLNHYLARQHKEQLTQRALLDTLKQFYSDALAQLCELPFSTHGVAVEKGRSALTPKVHAPFACVQQTLVSEALTFNRSSCALSNFPQEREPDQEYLATIGRDLAAAWREFALSSNAILLAKGNAIATHKQAV